MAAPLVEKRVLVAKEAVAYYEAIQEFLVAEAGEAPGRTSDAGQTSDTGQTPGNEPAAQAPSDAAAQGTELIGFGALHVMWEDLAEVRTLATHEGWRGHGVGSALLEQLLAKARELGVKRVFCLTFEVDFFTRHGFGIMEDQAPVDPEIYAELLRSPDEGVAEFLDLARVKPNTLGNTRMILDLEA